MIYGNIITTTTTTTTTSATVDVELVNAVVEDREALLAQRLEKAQAARQTVQEAQAEKKRLKEEGQLPDDASDSEGSDLDEEEKEFLKHTYGTKDGAAPASPAAAVIDTTPQRTAGGGLRSPIISRPSVKTLAKKYDKWVVSGIFAVDLTEL